MYTVLCSSTRTVLSTFDRRATAPTRDSLGDTRARTVSLTARHRCDRPRNITFHVTSHACSDLTPQRQQPHRREATPHAQRLTRNSRAPVMCVDLDGHPRTSK